MGNLRTGMVVVLTALGATACQPMYGAPAQRLRTPEPIKQPAELPGDAAKIVVVYDEECALLTRQVKSPRRDPSKAEELTRDADAKVAEAVTVAEPIRKGDLFVDGIEEYGKALEKDPFNAEATLKLAVAYDKVQRKGCALALIGRLYELSQHPTYAGPANDWLDELAQRKNRAWFEGYRREALKAAGR